ncbi:hypothetical protein Emed_007375 [Eimeria media]
MEGLSSARAPSADDAQQEVPDDGPMHVTSRSTNGPNEGVVHHEEDEEVMHLGDEGLSLHARGPKKSTKHADIETTGENEGESTSVLTKSTQEKVLLPPVEKDIEEPPPAVSSTPEKPPSTDIEELESQQSELGDKVELLRQSWEHAGQEVKMIFVSKFELFKQLFPGDSRSAALAVDEQVLDDILIPAAKVQEAPIPTTPEGRVTLRRQLLLMNACVSVAQRQLTSWQDFLHARLMQQGQLAKTSSVSVATFMGLIEDEAELTRLEVLDQSSPQIPGILASDVAMSVMETRLQAAAAAELYDAFVPFLKEFKVAEHWADELHVPEGGVFPAASFISFMEKTQRIRENISGLVSQAAKKLVDNSLLREPTHVFPTLRVVLQTRRRPWKT